MSSHKQTKKRKSFEGYDELDQWDDEMIALWVKENERMEKEYDRLQSKLHELKERACNRREFTERIRRRYVKEKTACVVTQRCSECKLWGSRLKDEKCYHCFPAPENPSFHFQRASGSHTVEDRDMGPVRGDANECIACKLNPNIPSPQID